MKTNPSPAERRHAAQTALQALSTQRDEHRAELQDALARHQRQLLVT
jgi:hypothetical protein